MKFFMKFKLLLVLLNYTFSRIPKRNVIIKMCRKKGWVLGMTQNKMKTLQESNEWWGMWVSVLKPLKGVKNKLSKSGNIVSRKIFGLIVWINFLKIFINNLEYSTGYPTIFLEIFFLPIWKENTKGTGSPRKKE